MSRLIDLWLERREREGATYHWGRVLTPDERQRLADGEDPLNIYNYDLSLPAFTVPEEWQCVLLHNHDGKQELYVNGNLEVKRWNL